MGCASRGEKSRGLNNLKKLLKVAGVTLVFCFGLGLIVSKVEEGKGRKGWVNGHKTYGFYEKNVKRSLDFGLSLFALIVLWPVMLVTAIAVRLKLGKPVLFKQERPGLGGKIFIIRKYRTMLDGDGSDEERLTDFGRKLRSTSIDELPELFNIIRGDMSIIGPRPLIPRYVPYFTEEEKHRQDIRPGLTGLAQTSGRNMLSWNKRFVLDVEYANRITFLGDVQIIIKTIKKVLKKEGIVVRGTEGSVLDFDVERQMKTVLKNNR